MTDTAASDAVSAATAAAAPAAVPSPSVSEAGASAAAPAASGPTPLVNEIENFFDGKLTGNSILDFKLFADFTIGNLIGVLIIAVVVFVLIKIVSRLIRRGLSGKIDAKNIDGTVKLACGVIIFLGILGASPLLHIDFNGLLVAGGVVGVAVGFASQNTLSNFIAGILLMIERPIGIGDEINIAGFEGYVETISLLSTKIKTYDGDILRIPNSTVFSAQITNLVTNVARRFVYSIDIRYTDDAEKAVRIIRETALRNPYILTEPAPSIYVNELGAHGINILVKLWSPSQYWWDAKIEVLWTLFKALRKGGIDIPFNQLTLWYGEDDAAKLQSSIDTDKSAAEIIGHKKEGGCFMKNSESCTEPGSDPGVFSRALADTASPEMEVRRAAEEVLAAEIVSSPGRIGEVIEAIRTGDVTSRWYLSRALIKAGDLMSGSDDLIAVLIEHAAGEEDSDVLRYIGAVLASFGEKAVRPLISLFASENAKARGMAASALDRIGQPALDELLAAAKSENPAVRVCAGLVLQKGGVYRY